MDVPLCTCGLLGTELRLPGVAACALHTGPYCQPLFIISKPHLFILCICCPVPDSSSVNTHFIYSYHPVLTKAQRNSLSSQTFTDVFYWQRIWLDYSLIP